MGSATTVEVKCGSATEVIPSHGGYIVQARVGGAVFDIGIKFLYDLTPWQERALGIRAGEAHRHQRLFVSTGSSISLRAVTDDMAPT